MIIGLGSDLCNIERIQASLDRLGLPMEKTALVLHRTGNTSSASIPLTMRVRAEAQLAKPTKWLLLGFGAGLSWSGIALETDHVETAPVVEI